MIGNIIASPGFVEQFATRSLEDDTPLWASSVLSAWSSIMSVGQMMGFASISFVSNNFSRRFALYWLLFILATNIICESVAETWPVWLVGKFLAGLGIGSLQTTRRHILQSLLLSASVVVY
jgi:predicted MFS family arabinose efflux permease